MADEELGQKKDSVVSSVAVVGYADRYFSKQSYKLCWAMIGPSIAASTTNLFKRHKRKHPKDHAKSVSVRVVQPNSSVSHKVPKRKQFSLTNRLGQSEKIQSSKGWKEVTKTVTCISIWLR